MISSFIPIDGGLGGSISKATPPSYKITELKRDPTWTTYSTGWFTGSDNINNPDITINRTKDQDEVHYTYYNRFGIFINKRAETPSDGKGLINIESDWDQRFPETIKLRYPGSETKGNINTLKQLDNEVNYDFKIWQNRFSEGTISSADLYNNNNFKKMSTSEYFHDLLNFLNINKSLSYQEWLEMPSFSLKNLLGKSISTNNVIYQLYKIDDVNVQSLSTNFDEYIPWCFDQNGKKIEQHKIALIYSFNKKEVYILLELRISDIYYPDEEDEENELESTELREIKNIIFWRSGITDTRIDNISRSYDKTMLVRNVTGPTGTRKEAANISDYFRDQTVDSETVVSFQKDRFEDGQIIEGDGEKDNDNGIYYVEGNTSSGYEELEYGKTVPIVLTGNKNTAKEKIKIVDGYLFNNQNKNMFNIFVNGELQHMKDIEIVNQEASGGVPVTFLELPNVNSGFVEIYINSFSSPNLFMYLNEDKTINDIDSDNLKATLYYSGLLWKLDGEEQVIIFEGGLYKGTETLGKTLILHGINFDLTPTVPPITEEDLPKEVDKLALEEFTSYRKIKYGTNTNGIVYDPMYMEVITTSSTNTDQDIMTEDMWIFDNTYSDIKMDDNDNEPYLVYDNENNIKVFGVMDPNIDLVNINTKHIGEKYSIADFTKAIEDGNILSVVLDNAGQATYLKKHYEQMSVINNNVFNMFILSGYNETESWNPLPKNTELKINKDYAIVRFKPTDEDDQFPLMEIDRTYNFDGENTRVWTKVKPVQDGQHLYYIINRSADEFGDLYGHKFDKPVEYIII